MANNDYILQGALGGLASGIEFWTQQTLAQRARQQAIQDEENAYQRGLKREEGEYQRDLGREKFKEEKRKGEFEAGVKLYELGLTPQPVPLPPNTQGPPAMGVTPETFREQTRGGFGGLAPAGIEGYEAMQKAFPVKDPVEEAIKEYELMMKEDEDAKRDLENEKLREQNRRRGLGLTPDPTTPPAGDKPKTLSPDAAAKYRRGITYWQGIVDNLTKNKTSVRTEEENATLEDARLQLASYQAALGGTAGQGGGDGDTEEIDVTGAPSKVVNGKTYYQVNNQWYEAE